MEGGGVAIEDGRPAEDLWAYRDEYVDGEMRRVHYSQRGKASRKVLVDEVITPK